VPKKQETTTTTNTPKEEVYLWMGPYVGRTLEHDASEDSFTVGEEYGTHRYTRADWKEEGMPVFEWRGAV
jgi:hypothetical protein